MFYEDQTILIRQVLTHAEYDKGGLEEVSTIAEISSEQEYAKLLAKALPHVIHTDAENARATTVLETLLAKRNRTREEKRLGELLTLLIEEFEEKHYALPRASPLEIVRHLMESNGLRQMDLLDVFGTPSVASEVLHGRRALSKTHIRRLSQRFHLSPELFFEQGR